MKVLPDPAGIAGEAAPRGALHHQGSRQDTGVVCDDAGPFRVGVRALRRVRAGRLVRRLIPANDKRPNAIEVAKPMIWRFRGALALAPSRPSSRQPACPLRTFA